MVYGYVRVSTDHQTKENQRYEILRFGEKQDLRIEDIVAHGDNVLVLKL